MAIASILKFIDQAMGYVHPDSEAVEPTPAPSASLYHRVVVFAAITVGTICAAAGGVFCVFEFASGKGKTLEINALSLIPIALGGFGAILGATSACLVAPHSFLVSPVGQKWMKLIGARNVTTTRIICAVFIAVVLGLPFGLSAYAAFLKKY